VRLLFVLITTGRLLLLYTECVVSDTNAMTIFQAICQLISTRSFNRDTHANRCTIVQENSLLYRWVLNDLLFHTKNAIISCFLRKRKETRETPERSKPKPARKVSLW